LISVGLGNGTGGGIFFLSSVSDIMSEHAEMQVSQMDAWVPVNSLWLRAGTRPQKLQRSFSGGVGVSGLTDRMLSYLRLPSEPYLGLGAKTSSMRP
jgi:hypothetical protein